MTGVQTCALPISDPSGDPLDTIQTAVECCPTQAISIVDSAEGAGDKEE